MRSYLYVEDVAAAFDVVLHKGKVRVMCGIGLIVGIPGDVVPSWLYLAP